MTPLTTDSQILFHKQNISEILTKDGRRIVVPAVTTKYLQHILHIFDEYISKQKINQFPLKAQEILIHLTQTTALVITLKIDYKPPNKIILCAK